jgi:hypothetical protein
MTDIGVKPSVIKLSAMIMAGTGGIFALSVGQTTIGGMLLTSVCTYAVAEHNGIKIGRNGG